MSSAGENGTIEGPGHPVGATILGGWKRSDSADPGAGATEWPTDRRSSTAESTFTSNTSSPCWLGAIEGPA
jgi:hypothetical protein